jgi:hypothetical protein
MESKLAICLGAIIAFPLVAIAGAVIAVYLLWVSLEDELA